MTLNAALPYPLSRARETITPRLHKRQQDTTHETNPSVFRSLSCHSSLARPSAKPTQHPQRSKQNKQNKERRRENAGTQDPYAINAGTGPERLGALSPAGRNMGRHMKRGSASWARVVHADGNGSTARVRAWAWEDGVRGWEVG